MAETNSLTDWMAELFRDPDARAEFHTNPEGYAAEQGFASLSSVDVRDALFLMADSQTAVYQNPDCGNAVLYPPPLPTQRGDGDGARYLSGYLANSCTLVEEEEARLGDSMHQTRRLGRRRLQPRGGLRGWCARDGRGRPGRRRRVRWRECGR